jgi:hypothetical protein
VPAGDVDFVDDEAEQGLLRMERDSAKKVAVWFAKEQP